MCSEVPDDTEGRAVEAESVCQADSSRMSHGKHWSGGNNIWEVLLRNGSF